MPLEEIFVGVDREDVYSLYRFRLYQRGGVKAKPGQATISQALLQKEADSGFSRGGQYRQRLRFFTDGLAIGSWEEVAKLLAEFRQRNDYQRRKNPIAQLGGLIFTLREQRSGGG